MILTEIDSLETRCERLTALFFSRDKLFTLILF